MSPPSQRSLAILGLLTILQAAAFEPVQGPFQATQPCPATIGINRPPDGVNIKAGQVYPALGLNRAGGDYLQIRLPDARPATRWVRRECGIWPADAAARPEASAAPAQGGRQPQKMLLAINWQPAFCESQPDKTECRTQTAGRFDASHFSLHGLWPEPPSLKYCNVPATDRATDERRRWQDLPPLDLQDATRRRLAQAMPGTASALERHEWIKHGSCSGMDPDSYFQTALALLEQVNQSLLRKIVAGRMGKTVAASQLRAAFEQSFGRGAGKALGLRCLRDGNRQLISEIRLKLKPPLNATTRLHDALDRSSPANSNCASGVVDRAGLE